MTAARADFIDDPKPVESPTDRTMSEQAGSTPATVTDMTERIAARAIIIAEAKRLLMARAELTEPEAHRWIQKTAMDRRAPKQTIAIGIIEALSEKS